MFFMIAFFIQCSSNTAEYIAPPQLTLYLMEMGAMGTEIPEEPTITPFQCLDSWLISKYSDRSQNRATYHLIGGRLSRVTLINQALSRQVVQTVEWVRNKQGINAWIRLVEWNWNVCRCIFKLFHRCIAWCGEVLPSCRSAFPSIGNSIYHAHPRFGFSWGRKRNVRIAYILCTPSILKYHQDENTLHHGKHYTE